MNLDLRFYWNLFVRRLPVMTLFVLLFSSLGIVTALQLKDTYSTSARLLLEAPQIPDNMVRSLVQTDDLEQLDIIEQRLMTRANLIDIANRLDVFEDIRQMEPDEVYGAMLAATTIRRRGGGRSSSNATMMILTFEGRSPQVVAAVVNAFVTLVLQENSRFRTQRAESTLDFFEQEVERLSADLNALDVKIAEFKSKNANALPQDQPYRLERQRVLQDRLSALVRDRRTAEQQRDAIVREAEQPESATTPTRSPMEEQLVVGLAELKMLRTNYGEDNPRVIRLKDRIARLEVIVAAEADSAKSQPGGDEADRRMALLAETKTKAENNIVAIQSQIDATTNELAELARNLSASATNALQLEQMQREYDIAKTRYSSAVTNLNSARMGERLEATAQGQRISVIENASVPQIPNGPNRLLIAAISIAVGSGLAIGYFLLLELINRKIRRPLELLERYDVTPLVTIPFMESRSQRMVRRSARATAVVAVVVLVPTSLWYLDANYLPLEVIVQKSLQKLGLG